MVQWTNYKAFTLDTPLNSSIASTDLAQFVEQLGGKKEFYHCYYDMEPRASYKNYEGLLKPVFDTIHIDLDSKPDGGLAAWNDTKKLVARLIESSVQPVVYFSGNKGFHIAIHKSAVGIDFGPHKEFSHKIKALLFSLQETYPTVDTAIWDPSRKFRSYKSFNKNGGLYKIRIDDMQMELADIKKLAEWPDQKEYVHPAPTQTCSWLQSLTNAPIKPPKQFNLQISEIKQGETIDDGFANYRTFEEKKCVAKMWLHNYPQFNRHDIGLRLIYDLRYTGISYETAELKITEWAEKTYHAEPDRIKDTLRQLKDAYSTVDSYKFGCYDDVKKAYCSARCKLYGMLDPKLRAEPLDCTKALKKENDLRRETEGEKLSEGQMADKIMEQMPELCKSNEQYFQWIGTHWNRIDGKKFEDSLTKVAMEMYKNQAPIKKVKALAEHVIAKIPIAPETNHFFAACPNKFNFTDCTAVMTQERGELTLTTKPHDKEDYLAYCAPFPLKAAHSLPKGTEFGKYMETRRGDVGEEGIRIMKQMLGAALIPYVPRIFFIEGITNSGKSTFAKLIMTLLGRENVSEVLPIIRTGGADRFNWEPSIGKLANIVLELPKGAELDVNTLKMVRDKATVSIDRKREKHVRATLPFLHIYCCNQMANSYEGNSGALNNRVTMLFFKPGYLNGSSGIMELAEAIWADDAGSVLEAAREGLEDLIESGFKYYESNDSKQATKEWQKLTDPIALYFDDVNSGEWPGPEFEGKEYEKGVSVFADFKRWAMEFGYRAIGKHRFYRELTQRFKLPHKPDSRGGERWNFASVIKRGVQNPTFKKSDTNPTALSMPEL